LFPTTRDTFNGEKEGERVKDSNTGKKKREPAGRKNGRVK